MEYIKNMLLYAGTDPASFKNIRLDLAKNNRHVLKLFALIGAVAMLGMLTASFFVENIRSFRYVYFSTSLVSFLIWLAVLKTPENKCVFLRAEVYLFIANLLAFGIAAGTILEPREMTASFLILIFALPLIFTDVPLRMCVAIFISLIVYVIAAKHTQDAHIFVSNLSNVIPYGTLSMFTSAYMMHMKAEHYILLQRNQFLSFSDQLTGLFNRNSYAAYLQELQGKGVPRGCIFCALDINGLKTVNDTLGHVAGDEMIQGAAQCILQVFGSSGICYRIGGDEFAVIIAEPREIPERYAEQLEACTRKWRGVMVAELMIAMGIVIARGGESTDALMREADMRMYENKARFYQQSGRDRRK